MKICSKCGSVKSKHLFYRNKWSRSGLRSECKSCTDEITRVRRQRFKLGRKK